MLTLRTVRVLATGSVLLFLLQFPMANLALCILFARTAPTGRPLVAQLAAEVVALRRPSAAHPGLDSFFRTVTWLWAGDAACQQLPDGLDLDFEAREFPARPGLTMMACTAPAGTPTADSLKRLAS